MSNIIRVNRDKYNPYAIIPKTILEDRRLSWAARGVLGYLLSKPDGWQVRFWDLIKQGNLKRDAMQKILKDLQAYGYMHRVRIQNEQGRFEWLTEVYENPDMNPNFSPLPDFPVMDEP